MKTNLLTFGIALVALAIAQPVCSQDTPTENIKKKSNKVINRQIDKSFSKIFGKDKGKEAEKPVTEQEGQATGGKQQQNEAGSAQQDSQGNTPEEVSIVKEAKPELKWSKYDFVPGDKVIFEDNLEGEENGEFPSRWDLRAGNVEVAEFGVE